MAAGIKTTYLSNEPNEEQDHANAEQNDRSITLGNNLPIAGAPNGANSHNSAEEPTRQNLALPGPPLYRALLPAMLPGTRCYTDASTGPDQPNPIRSPGVQDSGPSSLTPSSFVHLHQSYHGQRHLCPNGKGCGSRVSSLGDLRSRHPKSCLPLG